MQHRGLLGILAKQLEIDSVLLEGDLRRRLMIHRRHVTTPGHNRKEAFKLRPHRRLSPKHHHLVVPAKEETVRIRP